MKTPHLAKLCLLTAGILALPTLASAGTHTRDAKDAKIITKAAESCITGDIGLDVASQYIFHGISQENQGVIFQPYADIYLKIYEGGGFLNSATVNLGIWNSFHSRHPLPGSTRSWYEFDFLAGVSFVFAKNFTFTPTYIAYASPGDYFGTAHTVQLKLAYNDADLLRSYAMNPYVFAEFEFDGKTGNGTDEGIYYEVGISPGTKLGPVQINLPIKAGFGSSDYYVGDAGFGFFSVGVAVGYDLACIPSCLGKWTVGGSATYYRFGDPNDGANAIKSDDDDAFVFSGGLKVAF